MELAPRQEYMEYDNVVYVDSGYNYGYGRNAPAVVDHRTGARLPGRTTSVVQAMPAGQFQPQFQGPYAASPYAANPYAANPYTATPQGWYPVNPPYVNPPVVTSNNLTSILGGFGDIGSLSNIIAQAFAAFMPLPAAPTPQDSSDNDASANAATNSSNMIRYQNALALYAKRDQQILTLGAILKELFRRPGTVIG